MPFVTGGPTPRPAAALDAGAARAALASPDAATRRRAAQALGGNTQAKTLLLERLHLEAEANVRAALFASLAAMTEPDIAGLIAGFLKSRDPGLRGAATQALKQLQAAAAPAIDALLGGPDADLRLLAIEVTRAWSPARAIPRLRHVLEQDAQVNVCAAAVDIAAGLGRPELLGALGGLRQRFPRHDFIHFAAGHARARIEAAAAYTS